MVLLKYHLWQSFRANMLTRWERSASLPGITGRWAVEQCVEKAWGLAQPERPYLFRSGYARVGFNIFQIPSMNITEIRWHHRDQMATTTLEYFA